MPHERPLVVTLQMQVYDFFCMNHKSRHTGPRCWKSGFWVPTEWGRGKKEANDLEEARERLLGTGHGVFLDLGAGSWGTPLCIFHWCARVSSRELSVTFSGIL